MSLQGILAEHGTRSVYSVEGADTVMQSRKIQLFG